MSWRKENTDNGFDLVWEGAETGIGSSPLKGTANMQNVNIATETGEAMVSYGRFKQDQVAITNGTLTASVSDGIELLDAPSTLQAGQWINISSTTIASTTYSADYLVVAGGGGGGSGFLDATNGFSSGGGGAGGMKTGTLASLGTGSYAITVGAGGLGVTDAIGSNGANSSIAALVVSTGGGGGGKGNSGNGSAGGSGGGAGASAAAGTGGAGTVGQGNNGGAGFAGGGTDSAGGGGGGAGAVGTAGIMNVGGAGGAGTASSISGSSVTYAVGGRGQAEAEGSVVGAAGTTNRGNGGGASLTAATTAGGNGGSGIVIISYPTGTFTATGGTITTSGGNTIHTFTTSGTFEITTPAFGTGNYYVSYKNSSNKVKLSAEYDPSVAVPVTHGTSGTATFSVLATIGLPIAKATEKYNATTGTEYRYYILDDNNYVWVYDTAVYAATLSANGIGETWFLPDLDDYSPPDVFSGLAVLSGWLMVISQTEILAKPTVDLGKAFDNIRSGLTQISDDVPHFAFVGSLNKLYYTDGNYIGQLYPTTSIVTSIQNIQSYSKYTAVTTDGTISTIIGGSLPADGAATRIPAVFFTDSFGTQPTNLTVEVVYFIQGVLGAGTFNVYADASGGAAIDIAAGATGNQYFNTFFPLGDNEDDGNDEQPLYSWTPQRVNLPYFEQAQCIQEVGTTILIGGITNQIYPWNQIDAGSSEFIALPESNVKAIVNANNIAYVFAGNKGNIYVTNNSTASLIAKVPDYCAGVPGNVQSYFEPTFTWGDAMFLRGRIYFSILDQTSTKTGNCGGIWSFYPTQNMAYGQETGLALRLENQSSYGTYNGVCTVLLPNQEQAGTISPLYWSGWYSSISTPVYGIDQTYTLPTATAIIETDLLATGTFLEKDTFSQLEYKLATQLDTNDTVQLYWRTNSTDAWTSAGTVVEESGNRISGYFGINFQKTQWVQFRAILTSSLVSTTTLCRLVQIRLR